MLPTLALFLLLLEDERDRVLARLESGAHASVVFESPVFRPGVGLWISVRLGDDYEDGLRTGTEAATSMKHDSHPKYTGFMSRTSWYGWNYAGRKSKICISSRFVWITSAVTAQRWTRRVGSKNTQLKRTEKQCGPRTSSRGRHGRWMRYGRWMRPGSNGSVGKLKSFTLGRGTGQGSGTVLKTDCTCKGVGIVPSLCRHGNEAL